MLIGTNTGSVYYAVSDDGKSFFFSSEFYIAKNLADPGKGFAGFGNAKVRQLKNGNGLLVHLNDLKIEEFGLSGNMAELSLAAPAVEPLLQTQRRIELEYERQEERRQQLRRCTRCILPETMPFIAFDEEGVCNYCRNYQVRYLAGPRCPRGRAGASAPRQRRAPTASWRSAAAATAATGCTTSRTSSA